MQMDSCPFAVKYPGGVASDFKQSIGMLTGKFFNTIAYQEQKYQ